MLLLSRIYEMMLTKFTSYSIDDALEDFEREHGAAIVAVFVSASGTHRIWLSNPAIQTQEQHAWVQWQLKSVVTTAMQMEKEGGRG